jgi:hypothetical protein
LNCIQEKDGTMIGKAGLKAGLIGLAVMVVISLINQLLLAELFAAQPMLSLASCGVSVVLYVGIGVLAAFFLPAPRSAGDGAKAGLIAGLISAVVSVLLGVVILVIRTRSGAPLPGVTPEQLEMMEQQGMNLGLITLISGSVGAVCGAGLGAGAAAAGGALLAAIKPD